MQGKKTTGVIGIGSFGSAIANVLAENEQVLVYTRNEEQAKLVNQGNHDVLSKGIHATTSLQQVAEECELIFPIIPSASFRSMMQALSPYLRPYHILIHGTKGLDLNGRDIFTIKEKSLSGKEVHSMSNIIVQESSVVRIGCLSGPNLAAEIHAHQPAATVIASPFDEVIELGRNSLHSKRFRVFGSHDMVGAELSGVLKNAFAIGSGILEGMNLGKNMQALLITLGFNEMVGFGKVLGASKKSFFGPAGIGDLVATATSSNSRNFTFGTRLANGETLDYILANMSEVAEGVRTIKIMWLLARHYKLLAPITEMLHSVVFHKVDPRKAIDFLMTYPYAVDADYV